MTPILAVVVETDSHTISEASLECVAEARDLAVVLGAQVYALAPNHAAHADTLLAAHGADRVLLLVQPEVFSADMWLSILEAPLRQLSPVLILAPDSGHARAWLPRLAIRWKLPLITRCLSIWRGADGALECTRPVYSGASHERIAIPPGQPLLATLAIGARGVGHPATERHATIEQSTLTPPSTTARDQTIGHLPPDPRTVDISEAERVVAGGLGVGSPAGLDLLWQLADTLGAAVGGTRVIADRGWLPFERQIGSTGKTVAPQLYIAVGISGASQHTSGMTSSDTVVVINTDRAAPMFGFADLGLVGDLHQIVPQVIALLRQGSGGLNKDL